MTVSDKLLVAILKHKDSSTLLRINTDWIDGSEFIKYKYVIDYFRDNNELPGVRTFCADFSFVAAEADSRPTLYLRNLKDRFIFAQISENIPALLKKVKNNPRKVLAEISELASTLNSDNSNAREILYSDNADQRAEQYRERIKTGGVTYLSMGNELLDKLFYGYSKTDLVTFGGRAGSKKTWLICYLSLLCEAVLPDELGDILFITNEISTEEIQERMDCIKFLLPYAKFLGGKLSRPEFARYDKGLKTLTSSRIRFIENIVNLNEVEEKLILYRPSICFIDGSYLLEQDSPKAEWERIQKITRGLKRLTKVHCPIVNTTQLKRAGGKNEKNSSFDAQDDFAFGNSFVQDSDIAFRMFVDKEMEFRDEVGLQVAKGRRVASGTTPLFAAPMSTMSFDFYLPHYEPDPTVSVTIPTLPAAPKGMNVTAPLPINENFLDDY